MRRVCLFAFVLGAALIVSPVAEAQSAGDVQIANPNRKGSRLTFDVLTPGGPLLQNEDFEVTVNGLPVRDLIAIGTSGVTRPAGAVLALDTSGSMAGPAIVEAKKAAKRFLATIDPGTKVGLIGFSSNPRVYGGIDAARSGIAGTIGGLRAEGNTALYDAIIQAARMVEGRPPEQRNIVLLSDGANDDPGDDTRLTDALAAAREADATVFAVGLESEAYKADAIKKLAAQTDGKLFVTQDSTELTRLFGKLAKTLVNSYALDIKNPDPTASFLEVEVAVAGKVAASGSETFRFDLPGQDDAPAPTYSQLPLPVLITIVFLGVALVVFLTSESVRETRLSPADRVVWYEEDGGENINSEALINAAVLDRAKELATHLADRAGYLQKLEREIEGAGMRWRPGEVIVASFLLAIVGGILGFALWGPFGLLLGLVALCGPVGYIRFKASKRRRAFLEQLPDVLMLIAGALRAGYSLQQALAAVGEDAKPPASEEFRRGMAEIRLGATMDDTLQDMARRIGIIDFDWTVMAIEIQREVGGDLAEILETIGDTIRERERIRRQIRALTAEGRLSGWVLGILPFAFAAFLLLQSPDYLEPLFTTTLGWMMIGGAVFLMIVGAFWMRKIVRIEV